MSVAREAFKKHDLDFYDEINLQADQIIDAFTTATSFYAKHDIPVFEEDVNAVALFMNTSRFPLNDLALRKALVVMNDIQPGNRMYFSGKISATVTPGANSPLSPKGPASPEVAEILKGEGQFEEEIKPFEEMGYAGLTKFTEARARAREATRILIEAGYKIVDKKMTKDGKPVVITVLMWTDSRLYKLVEDLRVNLLRLGVDIEFRPFHDTSEMISLLNANQYDLFPQAMPIPRNFSVLDPDVLMQKFSSDYSKVLHPTVEINNYANFVSPTMDRILTEITSTDASTPRYKALIDGFLRVLSANMTFLLMGERTSFSFYADKRMCLPPVTRGASQAIIPTFYYADKCR